MPIFGTVSFFVGVKLFGLPYVLQSKRVKHHKLHSIMALIKTEEQREIDMLQNVEKHLERRERRERIHHLLIAGLGLLSLGAYFVGHATGHCKRRR